MSRTRKTYLAFFAALVLVVAACGGESVDEPAVTTTSAVAADTAPEPTTTTVAQTTSTTAATTTSTSTVAVSVLDEPVPLESVAGGSIRGNGWLVEPGRYFTNFSDHRFTFTITEPVVWVESGARITFRGTSGVEGEDVFLITNYVGVIPPDRALEHAPHAPVVPTYADPMPESLGDWLTEVTQLTPSAQMDVVGGDGVEAMAWDVAVDTSNGGGFQCPRGRGECVSALVNPDEGVYIFWEGSSFRVWQFGGAADGLYGFMQSRVSEVEDTIGLAEMIIGGMSVEPTA